MKRSTYHLLTLGSVVFGVSVACAAPPATHRAVQEDVNSILRLEATGTAIDRLELLNDLPRRGRPDAAVHWHAGEVEAAGEWRRFDQVRPDEEQQALRAEYRQRRDLSPQSEENLLALADWCRSNNLLDQERTHLLEILELNPQSPVILTRLGYRPVAGLWLSPAELAMLQEEQNDRREAIEKWQSRLIELRDDLNANSRRRQRAQRRLARIKAPSAVYAIEHVFFGGSDTVELAAAEALGRISAFQATHALVALSVESDDLRVRNAATEQLAQKPRSESMPALLGRLAGATDTHFTARYHDGRTFVRQVYYRERQYQRHAAVIETTVRSVGRGSPFGHVYDAVAATNNQRYAEELVRQQQETARLINEQSEKNNARVYAVLKSVTDVDLPQEPNPWWEWWNKEQDIDVPRKPYEYEYEKRYREIEVPITFYGLGNTYSRPVNSSSCFRAGTPVWTDEGFVPIESVRAGDYVLAKNIETGELAYQVVLKPTQRTPQDLKALMLSGGETFVCTSGHPFWRSGHGWTMANDLSAGDLLHGVTGAHKVAGVSDGPTEPVYNLIVDGFHTYFVGRSMVLSHDNTIRRPTNAVVPGLMRDELVVE